MSTALAREFGKTLLDVRNGFKLRRVWLYLAKEELFSRYRRSLLGPFWVSAQMLATAAALAIVMGGIFGQPIDVVLPFIAAGILVWNVAALPLGEGAETFVTAAPTIKTYPFPFSLYVLRLITRHLLIYAHGLVVVVPITFILNPSYVPHWSFILTTPLVFVFGALFSGVSGMFSARFRDLRFLLPFLAQIIFFLTPIFWRPDQLSGARAAVYLYNPFYYLVEIVRSPLLGVPPRMDHILVVIGMIAAGALAWLFAFTLFRRRIAFWI